jgi:FtsP/CotA-like multicopper oxidase with cupredoxin domain
MHSRLFSHLRLGLMVLLATLLAAASPASSALGQVSGTESDAGLICVTDPNNTFNFATTDGYISIPDGNTVYMWGYAVDVDADLDGRPDFQHPGPSLCVTEGSTVTINLRNTLTEDVSIIFPGQSGVTATGGIVAANSLAQAAAANGGTVSYSFVAGLPGSFLYESGTNLQKQVQMGLFGSLVVRPASQTATDWFVFNDPATQFNPNDEYMMLLSEIDPDLHAAVELGQPFDFRQYHPRYWLINGRAFPDTIAPNFANWLPTQPYGALLHIFPTSAGSHPSAMRMLNVGALQHPIHPHGDHVRVIGRDGRPLASPYEKFDVNVGPGQTWDTLYDWSNMDGWDPVTNPLPPDATDLDAFGDWLNPRNQNQLFKGPNFYSGSPYLGDPFGNKDDDSTASYNECGEYYHIWHSHALNEASNYEAGFGGMITLERIDPPLPNSCLTQP